MLPDYYFVCFVWIKQVLIKFNATLATILFIYINIYILLIKLIFLFSMVQLVLKIESLKRVIIFEFES